MNAQLSGGQSDEMPFVRFVTAPGSDVGLTLKPLAPCVLRGFIAGDPALTLVAVRSHLGSERVTCLKLAGGTRVWLLDRPVFVAPGSSPIELVWRSSKARGTEVEVLWSADERSIAAALRVVP